MRSIEYLVQLYPDKTGKELLEIQKKDKEADDKKFQKFHKKKMEFIADLNSNGGYFRGQHGLGQFFYYKVYDLVMDKSGEVRMKVDTVVMHVGYKHGVLPEGQISFERRTKEYENMDTYALDSRELCERVTVKEWEAVNAYVDVMPTKFWNPKK